MKLSEEKTEKLIKIYEEYVKEVLDIKDISRWCVKKSVTEKLYESSRANETKVVDAIGDKPVQIGDKIFLFNDIDGEIQKVVKGEPVFYKKTGLPNMIPNKVLKLKEDYDGSYDLEHYVDRVYKTVQILENIVDMERIPVYTSVKGKKLLEELK